MRATAIKAVMAGALAACAAAADAAQVTINGAGATYPYPVYAKWFSVYHEKTGVRINYQSIGSGGGIRQISKKTVDFGATDGPMTQKQLDEVSSEILHLPTVIGAVVAAYNLNDASGKPIRTLRLSGPALAGIYLGKITAWNDAALRELNPGVALPDSPITVLRRADGSGTTYCFVDYLAAVSSEWKERVGVGTSVRWPVGLGAKGNEGVAGLLLQTPNAIGYIEAIYAKQSGLPHAAMRNKAGRFVSAEIESVTAAANGVEMPADFRVSIVDAKGKRAYPIASYTWLLVYRNNPPGKGKAIKDFLSWMLVDGQKIAPDLGFSPLPAGVLRSLRAVVKTIK